jgi:AraC-like DNA-binding protein
MGYVRNEMPGPINPQYPRPYFYVWEEGRVLPEYQLIYFTRGEGVFESECAGEQVVTRGDVLTLFPQVWRRLRPGAQVGWDGYWICLDGEYVHALRQRGFVAPRSPVKHVGLDEALLHAYRRAWERAQQDRAGLQQFLASNAMEVLAAALVAAQIGPPKWARGAVIEQAQRILRERCDEPVELDDLAASLGLSCERFRHLFKQHTRMSPHQYHLQLRIRRAQELLRTTSLSVRQIAASLRFDDVYYFSKIFKQKTGLAPLHWRGSPVRKGRRRPGRSLAKADQKRHLS